ncbi:universal stress protein [Amaricoccus sp.]|uniref:universal stress protein n=1 Tax=Amaricoccus sp. TaxID=1872485 RepID=UPI001B63E9ED|nr:universal stress protein [Amaricoccus sp.]MBP7241788.1 universal stress protein [Amaricoccus sp.]
MYAHILIPTDGSPLAEQAVNHGLALAKALGSRVTVLTVVEQFDVLRHFTVDDRVRLDELMERFERGASALATKILGAAAEKAAALGVPAATVQAQSNHPWEAIVKQAEESGADLIVMASHGRRGVSALLIGSETLKVLTHSKVPVQVLR